MLRCTIYTTGLTASSFEQRALALRNFWAIFRSLVNVVALILLGFHVCLICCYHSTNIWTLNLVVVGIRDQQHQFLVYNHSHFVKIHK